MALFDGIRGGYKLVSFKDIPLKINDYVTVKGIYKRAQSIFVKRFVACHIIIEGVGDLGETDMMTYKDEDNHIIAQVGNYKLIISQSDVVQVVNQQGVKTVNGKSPNAQGNVTINATDIKLTTTSTTVQANIIRIDENADQMSQAIDALDQQVGQNTSFITAHAELLADHTESIGNINTTLTSQGMDIAKVKPYYVQVTISGTNVSLVDYTYDSLCAAITNGQNIVLYEGAITKYYYQLSCNTSNSSFEFTNQRYISSDGNKIQLKVIRIQAADNMTVISRTV